MNEDRYKYKSDKSYLTMKATAIALTISLCGCVTNTMDGDGKISPKNATAAALSPVASFSKLEQQYKTHPNDKAIALSYARALDENGKQEQSLAVVRKLVIAYPQERDVLATYGKALAASGQYRMALNTIGRAQTPEQPDWRLLTAEASIWDRLGQFNKARAIHQKAAELNPNEAAIASNLGMSYMLSGNLSQAETLLRKAVKMPGADTRMRQNLALIIGLQGRYAEAENIYAKELSAAEVKDNINYIKSIKSTKK